MAKADLMTRIVHDTDLTKQKREVPYHSLQGFARYRYLC